MTGLGAALVGAKSAGRRERTLVKFTAKVGLCLDL